MIASVALTIFLQQQIHPPIKQEYFDLTVPPPTAWYKQGSIDFELPGAPLGEIQLFTSRKELKLKWLTGPPFSYQRETVSYWPTAAAYVDERLVVAGKRRNLHTRIELWTFNHPIPLQTGPEYSASLTRSVLYDGNEAGKRRVRFLNPILSSDGVESALVHFGDSNNVYQIDLDTGALTLAITVEQQPALSMPEWQGIWAIDHDTSGFIYAYFTDPSFGIYDHLVLIDSDRDGSIDGSAYVDAASWVQGLGNPAHWIRVHHG